MVSEDEVAEALFIERPNRFLGRVELDGENIEVFIPNPGRMHELMIPGKQVYVRRKSGPHRRTQYNMIGVHHEDVIISIDSNLPNRFMKESLLNHQLDWFLPYDVVTPEPRIYDGRFDFKLDGSTGTTYIEVKSCTLVEDGHALFPDAPTKRGARHLRNLARTLQEGLANRAAVVFVIQRPDATKFSPKADTDPIFAEELENAHIQGVEIYPLVTEVKDWSLEFLRIIPYVKELV
ncbi:MAG: DNA/RNA nuclease SfsA, partial [Candidatus Thorarchaeota archaeon]|jgi:sugar fermentation stimulation protein A